MRDLLNEVELIKRIQAVAQIVQEIVQNWKRRFMAGRKFQFPDMCSRKSSMSEASEPLMWNLE